MHKNKWKWKYNPKPTDTVKAVLWKVHSNISLHLETRVKLNNQTLHLKQIEQEERKSLKVSRRKEIIKIRAEIKRNKGDYSKNQQN